MSIIKKVLIFNPIKCTGCQMCQQFCSMGHFNVINPSKSCIRIIRDHETQQDWAIHCHQCIDPPCIKSCDFEALSQNPETGAIVVFEENCVGCRKCIEKCPYAAPSLLEKDKHIIICDLCNGNPDCVEICPEQAIQYVEIEKANDLYKSIYIKKVANTLLQGDNKNE